jgi:opacity protein-like surface antigen
MLNRTAVMVCVLTLACGSQAFAQGWSAGIRGGLNLTDVKFDSEGDSPSLSNRLGFVGGGFVIVPLVSWLEVQPEALYTMKGARFDEEGIDSSLWLDYVEFPVLARVSRRTSGALRYYLAAGPSLAVRVRARTRTKFGSSTEEMDISDDVERTDFGVVFGGGVEFGSLVVDARYGLGLKDIDKDRTDDVKVTNRGLSLTAGVRF